VLGLVNQRKSSRLICQVKEYNTWAYLGGVSEFKPFQNESVPVVKCISQFSFI